MLIPGLRTKLIISGYRYIATRRSYYIHCDGPCLQRSNLGLDQTCLERQCSSSVREEGQREAKGYKSRTEHANSKKGRLVRPPKVQVWAATDSLVERWCPGNIADRAVPASWRGTPCRLFPGTKFRSSAGASHLPRAG